MSNVIEIGDKVYFHPGYYISQIIDETKSSIEEFANRLDVSSEYLNSLINGNIPLSEDIAKRLSKVLGTSVNYWLNLQNKVLGIVQ